MLHVRFRMTALLALLVLCVPSWGQNQDNPKEDDERMVAILSTGAEKMRSSKVAEAIAEHFDRVIEHYESKYRDGKRKAFSARSQPEMLLYLLEHANTGAKQEAAVYSYNWGVAYYLKGYALVELGRPGDAAIALDSALALSPRNSQFLTERGQLHLKEKNLVAAFEKFTAAETAAREFSPEGVKTIEVTRAIRGQGYVLIEQGRLEDAEKAYRRSLDLNGNDENSKGQLRYIAGVRERLADDAAMQANPMFKDFAFAWRMAEAQFISPSIRAYVRSYASGAIWNDNGTRRLAVMPDEKAIAECVTAIFPTPAKVRMVFVVDGEGIVSGALADQPGLVADCIKSKLIGFRIPVPPRNPMYFCSRFERIADDNTESSNCGPQPVAKICSQQGTTRRCRFESR